MKTIYQEPSPDDDRAFLPQELDPRPKRRARDTDQALETAEAAPETQTTAEATSETPEPSDALETKRRLNSEEAQAKTSMKRPTRGHKRRELSTLHTVQYQNTFKATGLPDKGQCATVFVVTSDEKMAYIAHKNGPIVAVDISQPKTPKQMAKTNEKYATVRWMRLNPNQNTLFIFSTNNNNFVRYDISDRSKFQGLKELKQDKNRPFSGLGLAANC